MTLSSHVAVGGSESLLSFLELIALKDAILVLVKIGEAEHRVSTLVLTGSTLSMNRMVVSVEACAKRVHSNLFKAIKRCCMMWPCCRSSTDKGDNSQETKIHLTEGWKDKLLAKGP